MEELPAARTPTGPILDDLELGRDEHPGMWRHVGTAATHDLAYARAQTLRKAGGRRGVEIETATRQVGKHVHIYARAVAP
jgi:hypothetical protein